MCRNFLVSLFVFKATKTIGDYLIGHEQKCYELVLPKELPEEEKKQDERM